MLAYQPEDVDVEALGQLVDAIGGILEEEHDPSAQYALLEEIILLASRAGDVTVAMAAVGDLTDMFEIDVLQRRIDALDELVRVGAVADDSGPLVHELLTTSRRAQRQGRFDLAQLALDHAVRVGTRTGNRELVEQGRRWHRELVERRQLAEQAEQAKGLLEQDFEDAEALRTRGRYHLIVTEDWEQGTSYLVRLAEDGPVQAAARADQIEPSEATQRASLADQWWALAEEARSDLDERAYRSRAAYWYELALPELSGLAGRLAERRLEQWQEQASPWDTPSISAEPVAPRGEQRAQIEIDHELFNEEQRRIVEGLEFGEFTIPTDRRWTYTKARITIVNRSPRGQIENDVHGRVRLLCVNADGERRVIEYVNNLRIGERGVITRGLSGIQNDIIAYHNDGQWIPRNAHMLVTFDGVPIHSELWRASEEPWWEDDELVVPDLRRNW